MEKKIIESEPETTISVEGGKFLSFYLGKEEYAIEILKVQEIIGLMPITPTPNMPEYIRGVLNLRGTIIPVMELRNRFNLKQVEDTSETCIIILQDKDIHMGIVVDRVSEVTFIDSSQIEDVPSSKFTDTNDYLSGIGKVKDTVKMILNMHKVVFNVPSNVLEASSKED